MKKIYLLFVISISFFLSVSAQNFTAGADIFNLYLWRGLELGGGQASIQPWAKYSFGNENHSFAAGAWGAYAIGGDVNQEFDLSLAYTYKSFLTITLNDYFFPGLNTGSREKYFEYGSDSTGHVFEGMIQYNGSEKIPFTLLFAMNFYGNDARKTDGSLFLSKYIEAGYKKNIGGIDFNAFAGLSLDNANEDKGETSYYLNNKPGLINLGIKLSKSIEITDKFALPLQCSVITNPDLNRIYLVCGISLSI